MKHSTQIEPAGHRRLNPLSKIDFDIARDVGKLVFCLFLAAILFCTSRVSGQGRTEQIAITGESAPGYAGNNAYSTFAYPRINRNGQLTFYSTVEGTGAAIFFANDSGNTWSANRIAGRLDPSTSGNGVHLDFSLFPSINQAGQLLFRSTLGSTAGGTADNTGIFRSDNQNFPVGVVREGDATSNSDGHYGDFPLAGSVFFNNSGNVVFSTEVNELGGGTHIGLFRQTAAGFEEFASQGQAAPDGNGTLSTFGIAGFNDGGQTIFSASMSNTNNGVDDDRGIWIWDGAYSPVVREGQTLPNGLGSYGNDLTAVLNNSGAVAFSADHTGAALGSWGVYYHDNGGTTQLVREGQSAPGGTETYSTFGPIFQFNDNNKVLFLSTLDDNSRGLYTANTSGEVTEVVREGMNSPDGNGIIDVIPLLGFISLGNDRQVAFRAVLANTNSGINDDEGLFIGDGEETLVAVRKGNMVDGSAISELAFARRGFNDHGQLSYRATLTDGREVIRVFTPDLHWRRNNSGSWQDNDNWTIGLNPAGVHQVFIDPDVNLGVNGPSTDTDVRQLVVGGGAGNASLGLIAGVTIAVEDGLAIAPNGTLLGSGIIDGNTSVRGTLRPSNSLSHIGTFSFLGDLEMVGAHWDVDLGGTEFGEYDRLRISDDFFLDGELNVGLLAGFDLSANMEFLIADVEGNLIGQFDGLSEQALVGTFDGTDLFITYAAGDGNDVALFTAVPEPSNFWLLALIVVTGLCLGRRIKKPRTSSKNRHRNQANNNGKRFVFQAIRSSALIVGILGAMSDNVSAQTVEWINQLGTGGIDLGHGVTTDSVGNVYITGQTDGSLSDTSNGGNDAFVNKYNAQGSLLWSRQLGTNSNEVGYGISADTNGNVFVTGYTGGNLDGAHQGNTDNFVSMYNSTGTLQWTRQSGTASLDRNRGVSADAFGNVYATGYTNGDLFETNLGISDVVLQKFDSNGTAIWSRQFGTSSTDEGRQVATDASGNIYIAGVTGGDMAGSNIGGNDAFVTKFDSAGTQLWTQQLGTTSGDLGESLAVDSLGNVYLAGTTDGNLAGANFGNADIFLFKFDTDGTELWSQQIGTILDDEAFGLDVDLLGNVFITGLTDGIMDTQRFGGEDVFLSMYDPSGSHLWTNQLGTGLDDVGRSVSADAFGNVFVTGYTRGALGGSNSGSFDAFVLKTNAIPEPSCLVLLFLIGIAWYSLSRRRMPLPLHRMTMVTMVFAGAIFGGSRLTAQDIFQGLGDLPGDLFDSRGNAVSPDGELVIGRSIPSNGNFEAFQWTSSGGMVGLGYLANGNWSGAYGVSGNGIIVGQSDSFTGPQATTWTLGGGTSSLGDLPGGVVDSIAYGISQDGSVIVGQGTSGTGEQAFRWTSSSGMELLSGVGSGEKWREPYPVTVRQLSERMFPATVRSAQNPRRFAGKTASCMVWVTFQAAVTKVVQVPFQPMVRSSSALAFPMATTARRFAGHLPGE